MDENRAMRLLKIVENTLIEFTAKRDNSDHFFYLFDKGSMAREAILELRELILDDKELYLLVRNAHLSLVNNMNIIRSNYLRSYAPLKIGKNLTYKLLEEYKHNKKYG